MSVGRCFLLAIVLAAFWPAAAAAQPMPGCQLTSDADGLVVTVAALGSPGIRLNLDWGDGAIGATAVPTAVGRGRVFLKHRYGAPGLYIVRANATTPDGRGCTVEWDTRLPATSSVGEDAADILPKRGAPDTSDMLPDSELGSAMPEPVATGAPPTFVQRVISAIGGFVSGLFGSR